MTCLKKTIRTALCLALLTTLPAQAEDAPAYTAAQKDVLSYMDAYTATLRDGTTIDYLLPTSGQSRTAANLKTITGPGDGNVWKQTTAGGDAKVLVATLTRYSSYNAPAFSNANAGKLGFDVWVTLAPDMSSLLTDAFGAHNDPGETGVKTRALQALGMPDPSRNDRFVEFLAAPNQAGAEAQMFRPAMNPNIDEQVADADAWTDPEGDWRKEWIVKNSSDNFSYSSPYPWTGLGYTYDWGVDNRNHQGPAEFIVPRESAAVTVSGVASAGSYIYAMRDAAGQHAGEMNGSFDVTATADTLWGRKDFFRNLYHGTQTADPRITVQSTGWIARGVLIDSANYTVSNSGTITVPTTGRQAHDADLGDNGIDSKKADNVFRIVNNDAPGPMTAAIGNFGIIGQSDLQASHTFEAETALPNGLRIQVTNAACGQLYSGASGLAVWRGAAGANDALTVDNYGTLFGAAQSTAAAPSGANAVTLNNYGTFVLRGGMAVNGDVLFGADSVLHIDPAQQGVLRIGDTLTVQQGAMLDVDTSGITLGQTSAQTFIEAAAVADATRFTTPDSAVIAYAQTAGPGGFSLSVERTASYREAETAQTENTSALASLFDSLPGTPAGAGGLVSTLDALSAADLGDALRTVQAEPHALTQLGGFNLARHFFDAMPKSPAAANAACAGWEFWGAPSASWTRMRTDGDHLGYRQTIRGGAVGMTRRAGAAWFGASFGAYDGTMHFRGVSGRDDATSFHGGLYGGFAAGGHTVDVQLAYGRIKHDTDRDVRLGATRARADYRDNAFSAAATYAYTARLGCWSLTPSMGVRFTHLRRGAADERVDGVADFLLASERETAVEFPIAVNASTKVSMGNGFVFTPKIRAAFVPEAGRRYTTARLGVQGVDGWAAAKSADRKRWRYEAGVEAAVAKGERFAAGIRYDFSGNSQTKEHRLAAVFSLGF